ncbi:aromatic prenyltransferase [Stachybotrys elegans]|uniref:Aromatic prenyltransferase n=1 Tax=Stachybotrys elegans TaxID=80388 RepID=A0A8K0SY11_9HYPO|nr:aromatic prenyltransferase [Stachybotrys elegans]
MAASVASAIPASSQFEPITKGPSAQEDQAFWSEALGQSLNTLLSTSQYNEEKKLYYLSWFNRWILPAMGPRPVNGKPHYTSSFTHDGSPLEWSLNWKEKKAGQTIRFTIEPSNPKTGTAADPLNQKAADDFLTKMLGSKDVPGLDLTRFHLFLNESNAPEDHAADIIAKSPPNRPLTRVLIAFDMEPGSDIVAKAYFLPGLKSIHTGIPVKSIVFDAIRKCDGPWGTYNASVDKFDSYLKSFDTSKSEAPQVFMFSNDCVADTASSRIKIYTDAAISKLADAQDVFSLGGAIGGTSMAEGLKAIAEFWCHLFGLDASDPSVRDKDVLPSSRGKGVFVFEMRPAQEGQAVPDIEVKMHMPGSWLGETDAEISQVLSGWFAKYGHGTLADRYEPDLSAAFPKHRLDSGNGGLAHTWISLTWAPKTGLYMTMYYTPKLPEFYFVPT